MCIAGVLMYLKAINIEQQLPKVVNLKGTDTKKASHGKCVGGYKHSEKNDIAYVYQYVHVSFS